MVNQTNVLCKHWRLEKAAKYVPRSQWNVIRASEMKKIQENPNILYNQQLNLFRSRMAKIKSKPKNKFYSKSSFKNDVKNELTSPLYMRLPLYESVRPEDRYKTIKDWKYEKGDNVVIVNNELEGFGSITEITDKLTAGTKTNLYALNKGGPKILNLTPKLFWDSDGSRNSYITEEDGYVKQEDIRLVIQDPETKAVTIVDDVDFSEEKHYDPKNDVMQFKRFVKHHPEIPLEYPLIKKEAGEHSTPAETVLKQTYNPINFFDSGIPEDVFSASKSMKTLDRALSRLVTPKIRNALIGEFDFPQTPAQRANETYKNQIKSIEEMRAGYFNDKTKEDIGKKIFEKLRADIA